MPQITFSFREDYCSQKVFSANISLVDRKKLYGWSEIKHFDEHGNEVKKIHLDSSGVVKMEEKSTSFQFFDDDGNVLTKEDLIVKKERSLFFYPRSPDDNSSSFEGVVELHPAGADWVLNLEVDSVYELSGIQTDALREFIGDKIFSFSFAYTRHSDYKSAFLLATGERVFILAGIDCFPAAVEINEENLIVLPEDFAKLGEEELDFNLM